MKACQDLWHEAVLPSFYARVPNAAKARIARLYVCLMIEARKIDLQDVEMVRERYRELTKFIQEVTKNE